MRAFLKTSAGRLLALAAGLMLVGGGAAALVGEPTATTILAPIFPVAIALGVVSVALAAYDQLGAALLAAIGLPLVLFAYAAALFVVIQYAPSFGWAFVVPGLGAFATALRPARSSDAADPRARPSGHELPSGA